MSDMSDNLTEEERGILAKFERNELRSIPDAEREAKCAREVARDTLKLKKK